MQLHYKTENLTYTKGGLVVLSFWLLWGDFAFSFFESVFARFMPIFLKELQASNTLIGVMTGSFAGLVNILFLPGISRYSDSLRTSIGRRIPLLYVVTPLTVASLVAVGFAPEIGEGLFDAFSNHLPAGWSRTGCILALLCGFVVCFHFFNMVLVNSYNWLIRDVVPLEVMSRFLAWFSMVGTLSGMLFLWFVFPHLLTNRKNIFLVVGIIYLLTFFLMCWKVKEGEYPPPTIIKSRSGILSMFFVYFRECLQISIYRNFFIFYLLVTAAVNCAGNFIVLFASHTLQMNMAEMGHLYAWTAGISLFFYYPVGWLCDHFSPLHVTLTAVIAMSIVSLSAPFLIHTQDGFFAYSIVFSLAGLAYYLSQRAASMLLFPAEKFGQFSGALNVFGCGALIVGNILIGVFIDVSQSNYRIAFIWSAVISAFAILPVILVIRGWNKHGGRAAYVAPLPGLD